MKKRRKKEKAVWLIRFVKLLFKNWLVRRTALVLLVFVVSVNGIVTLMGASGAFILSPVHLWNKSQAIGFYVTHKVRQLVKPAPLSPQNALLRASREYGVPPKLVFAIAKAESDFHPHRVSRTGAMGLMQIMPDTAKNLGVKDPFHPEDNADGGAKYLSQLWRRYDGDIRRVVAAYNYGPGRVPRSGPYHVPPETKAYVSRVIQYQQQM
jgi:soluble lytic murein transglycosylase-like protein